MMSTSGRSANRLQRIRSRRRSRRSSPLPVPSFCVRLSAGGSGNVRGFSGASSRTGVGLRRASAIALLSLHITRGTVLDCLAQVLFHHAKLIDHVLHALAPDAGERRCHQLLAKIAELIQERPRRWRKEEPFGAAVDRIGPALDQAAVA